MALPPIGSHMSIAGGVHLAPGRAASAGCTAVQLFVKNNRGWSSPPIAAAHASAFPEELVRAGIDRRHAFAHTCYLINLGSPKADVVEKSVAALEDELLRCEQLGLPGLVMHPGAHLGTGRDAALAQIVELTLRVFERTPGVRTRLLFETTAGTGTNLGGPFEDIAEILRKIGRPDRAGVCLDTCHIFAAGYDIRREDVYTATMAEFERTIGFANLHAVHLNDSAHPLGSKKDRHEHIGKGHLGEEAFRLLMRDPRFAAVPMSLETEKEDDLEMDRVNLATLRRLAATEAPLA